VSALLGGILSIIHPTLFKASMTCMQLIHENLDFVTKNKGLKRIMEMWSAPLHWAFGNE